MTIKFEILKMTKPIPSFHWLDYFLCGLSLVMSLSIGIYYGIKGMYRKENKNEEFLMAGRSLHPLPVSLSLMVSWLSAITFIGDPVEVYYNGAVYLYIGVGYCIGLPLVAHMFAGNFNRMKITSVNEYLFQRYNHITQMCVSILNIICGSLFIGIVIYAPSVALSQVTGLDEWISILLIGSIGTFYTVLGGMRAVVWADALQSIIMLAGIIAVLIQGLITVGGFQNVIQIAKKGGRLNLFKSSWSPLIRSTILSYLSGGFFRIIIPYACYPACVQRYLVLPTPRKAKVTVYLNIPMFIFLVATMTLIGLTMHAYYYGCDPLKAGRIKSPDQMVPLFVMEMLGFLPGLPGVFLASMFAASLSSVSSAINAFAANVLKDFVEPIYEKRTSKLLSDRVGTRIAKISTLCFGIFPTGFAFVTLFLRVNIFPFNAKISGMLAGPMGAVFFLGFAFIFIETWNVLLAVALSCAFCLWIGFGAFFYPPAPDLLPTFTDYCDNRAFYGNITDKTSESTIINITSLNTFVQDQGFQFSDLYNLSPLLYGPLGYICTVVLALLFAVITNCWNYMSFHKGKEKGTFLITESVNGNL